MCKSSVVSFEVFAMGRKWRVNQYCTVQPGTPADLARSCSRKYAATTSAEQIFQLAKSQIKITTTKKNGNDALGAFADASRFQLRALREFQRRHLSGRPVGARDECKAVQKDEQTYTYP